MVESVELTGEQKEESVALFRSEATKALGLGDGRWGSLFRYRPVIVFFAGALVAATSMFLARYYYSNQCEHDAELTVDLLRPPMGDIPYRFRREISAAAFELMRGDTPEAAAESLFVDISDLVELVNQALGVLGVRGVYEEVFETYRLVVGFQDEARAQGLWDFEMHVVKGHQGMRPHHIGILNSRGFQNLSTGCIWWLRHWLGAMTADKLIREGSLRLDEKTDERIDAPGYFKEIQRMQRVKYPDILPFHVQHGFMWHYLATMRPDLKTYPLDLAEDFCGDLLFKHEHVEAVNNDIDRECRHAFGHGVFYVLANRENVWPENFSVHHQMRIGTGFTLRNETVCEAYRICAQAPNKNAESDCNGGFRHSSWLFDSGHHTPEMKVKSQQQKEICATVPP